MPGKCVLVTGGAGYIGSHTALELVSAGYTPVIVDNLSNSCMDSVKQIEDIAGQQILRHNLNLTDKSALDELFKQYKFDYVMHFAGLKSVGQSCELPLLYYQNNLQGTMTLLEVMKEHEVNNIVFSSSATVYGVPQYLPIDEKHPVGSCTNPYGKSKYFIEEIMSDMVKADKDLNVILLRYFNPVGSHKSGKIGEDPQGPPNNLMPYVSQVAVGRRPVLSVFGDDYDTPDGTGVRDYIHVVDLALGHVAALKKLDEKCGLKVYNLGTGNGYSVLEMIQAFEKVSGKKVTYQIVGRRSGDVASCYADPALAAEDLKWKAERGLEEMCEDLWRWQSMNPLGFQPSSAQSEDAANGTS